MPRTTFNLGTITTRRVSFGSGVLKYSTTGTPSTDVGLASRTELAITTESLDIYSNIPRRLAETIITQRTAILSFNLNEWERDALLTLLGFGSKPSSGNTFVGNVAKKSSGDIAVRLNLEHEFPDGSLMTYRFWKCIPEGNLSIPMESDNIHELLLSFKLMPVDSEWSGTAFGSLSPAESTQQLFRIERSATW